MPVDFRRACLAPTLAVVLSALTGLMHVHATEVPYTVEGKDEERRPSALSPADRLSYTTAFDALRRGDLDAARAAARQAQDRVLLGQVEFESLFHRDHTATYDELTAWLALYSDLSTAPRVYNLAMQRRPDGAPEPRRPGGVVARTWDSLVAAGGNREADPARAARVALNNDDLRGAVSLGGQIGDWWTVGLAQYRLGDYGPAIEAFERVYDDPTEDAWVRAGAAFWAAKSAGMAGRQNRIQPNLRRAAQWPATFYGQIALRQLGEEPAIENMGPVPYSAVASVRQASWAGDDTSDIDNAEMEAFLRDDAQARRTLAWLEVGRGSEAREELRTGLRGAITERGRRLWGALGRMMGPRLGGRDDEARRINAERFPQPMIEPAGGFTIERSLVYAIARKETDFNPRARSAVGAYGLMQVMPATAAELSGDRGLISSPDRLFDPNLNAQLGQAYVNKVLAMPAINGDLLRATASYNAGPGPMVAAVRKLGPNADPLLLIETIDVPQAREYVEKVVAAYWIYQRMNGRPLNTLDAVASGASLVPLSLDYVAPPPMPAQPVDYAQAQVPAGSP
ncbi:lytic transglycosylase domain-containing protein [Brevundimonas sp.]